MKAENKVIRKRRRKYSVRYPLRLKYNQLAIVKPAKGKPYQLVEGDVITKEFLQDDDIAEVRLIHMDYWNAVYTILVKAERVDMDKLRELQEKNGYDALVRLLASRLLTYVAEGNYFDRDGGLHGDACAFGEYNEYGKCVKSGLDYSAEDRMKAVVLATEYNPSLWRQTSALLYENYRKESDNYDPEEIARITLEHETDEESKAFEKDMINDWNDFIEQKEVEEKERHKKKMSKVIKLVTK